MLFLFIFFSMFFCFNTWPYSVLYWLSLLQIKLLQVHLYMTLPYRYSFKVEMVHTTGKYCMKSYKWTFNHSKYMPAKWLLNHVNYDKSCRDTYICSQCLPLRSPGWVLPYLGMVGRFRGHDPHFGDFQSDWVPILYINSIWLTEKKSGCLYHIYFQRN